MGSSIEKKKLRESSWISNKELVAKGAAGKVFMERIMHLRHTVIASMLALGMLAAPAMGARVEFDVNVAPPPDRVEPAPPPRAGYTWEPGYWRYDNDRYAWAEGHWVQNREGHHYRPHHWEHRGDKWHFEAGHWDDD